MTMQTRPRHGVLLSLLACAVVCVPATGWAQDAFMTWPVKARTSLFGPNPFGNVEVGLRNIAGDTESSKFQEYREIPDGLFLPRLWFSIENPEKTAFFEVRARDVRQRDQSVFLAAGLTRTLRFEVEWDQVPHTFSTSGRTILQYSGAGAYALNPALRAALAANPASAAELVPAAAVPQELAISQNTGRGLVRITPSDTWDVRVQYSDEKQTGTRAIGTNFGFNPIEQPEPIDYRTHLVAANAEYVRGASVVQVGYNLSLFRNRVQTLTWENPFTVTEAVNAPSMGRLDLYPNNDAHNVSVTAATKLPLSGRVAATVNTGWMLQNDPFLPFTINTALAPLLPALPAQSLDGRIRTLLMNYAVTMRPTKRVSLTARYRLYDLNNHTPALIFAAYGASGDSSRSADARRNVPYAYSRQNGGVDVSVQLARGVSAKGLFEREVWNREHREVEHNVDNTYGAAVDLAPNGWLNLRTSYRHSIRRVDDYDPEATAHFGFPFGETGLGQLHELRKFDQADRDRDRVDGLIQLSPLESLSFNVSYGVNNDDFVDSKYGLLFNKSNTASFDVTYSPVAQVAFYGEYGREVFTYALQSRYRVPAGATPAVDFPRDDWRRDMRDRMATWAAGIDAVWTERLNANVSYSRARATGIVHTRALSPLAIAQVATTAVDYPDTVNRLQTLMSSLRYRLREDLAARLEYVYDRYDEDDFASDVIEPIVTALDPATTRSVFLGARQPGYRAHIVAVTLQYRF